MTMITPKCAHKFFFLFFSEICIIVCTVTAHITLYACFVRGRPRERGGRHVEHENEAKLGLSFVGSPFFGPEMTLLGSWKREKMEKQNVI